MVGEKETLKYIINLLKAFSVSKSALRDSIIFWKSYFP